VSKNKELHFEDLIEAHLLGDGWDKVDPHGIDPRTGLFVGELIEFVRSTQPDRWESLVAVYPSELDAETGLANRVGKELDNPSRNGVVDLLRHGVTDLGVSFDLAYFRPAHSLTDDLEALYQSNRLGIVRQLNVGKWKLAASQEIDLTFVVNGIPVATAELKNFRTGQNKDHAVAQYREQRDPVNQVLRRCVVHFAVDPDSAMMTTRLAGDATEFLPFNRGDHGGAGNETVEGKHRTFYLWEQVWSPDRWMDLLHRFVHTETDPDTKQQKTIFPRYHQWDAVLQLVKATVKDGPGASYLIQHSAGSGKSNTIAWTAHRLSNLHDVDNEKVFDKVLVITDRVVLDNALGETVHQFEGVHGVVKRIDSDGGSKSANLAAALTDNTSKIIVCTIQTFGFVIDLLKDAGAELGSKSFAVLVDEAHSSQTGSAASDARAALQVKAGDDAALEAAEAESAQFEATAKDDEDRFADLVAGRGRQDNISYYAFTATPKPRTREMFGTLVDIDSEKRYAAFHDYTMRQAIEEGFILDVLENYTTYKTFWKIEKSVRDDPKFDERRAKAAIARFVSLHPTNLAQKAEVIVEHFRQKVAGRIGGRAKAMVVTSSRLHAVRYKQAIDRYIRDKGYDDIKALVAFSGKVIADGDDFTETSMNGFPMSQTVNRFDTDEYQVMIVAEKFQTGFDQPLLQTMYVDKPLHGLNTVQTLSRLNRRHAMKERVFVLDFRNEVEDVVADFAPYYEHATAAPTDPNLMYDARTQLGAFDVVRDSDVDDHALAFLSDDVNAHGRTEAALNPAVDRYRSLSEEDQETFKEALDNFVRLYSFLSQVAPFTDISLEKLYIYGKALQLKIRDGRGARFDLSDKIQMTHLKTEVTFEGAGVVDPVHEHDQFWGSRQLSEDAEEALSVIVKEMNERHGEDLTEAHMLTLDQYTGRFAAEPAVVEAARANNDFEAFRKIAFSPVFLDTIISQMNTNEEVFKLILSDERMRDAFERYVAQTVYDTARDVA
jgi:type I restriction enzyme R subunit